MVGAGRRQEWMQEDQLEGCCRITDEKRWWLRFGWWQWKWREVDSTGYVSEVE